VSTAYESKEAVCSGSEDGFGGCDDCGGGDLDCGGDDDDCGGGNDGLTLPEAQASAASYGAHRPSR